MFENQTRLRVRYAETDQMGVVYYANYFVWMELGRVEFCRAIGLRYRDMEQNDGVLLAVVEAGCRYLYPARYDEEVVLRTTLQLARPRMVRFGYEMFDATASRKLATGFTSHIFCNPEMRPLKLPPKYLSLFEGAASDRKIPESGSR
jgi:acyl-CoA thioester hydrolase